MAQSINPPSSIARRIIFGTNIMVFKCGSCWKEFPAGWKARDQHLRATGHDQPDWECFGCDRCFVSERAREQHMDALNHWNGEQPKIECDHCYDCFTDDDEYDEHLRDSHIKCFHCRLCFASVWAREQHMDDFDHWNGEKPFECNYCWQCFTSHDYDEHLRDVHSMCFDCDRIFGSDEAREQHMNVLGYWNGHKPPVDCDHCSECFTDDDDYAEHLRDDHHKCIECDRLFCNANNLKMHLMSKTHRTSTIKCPFCGTERGTATGVVHHLEQGSCPRAPLDRDKLYQAVRRLDPKGIISNRLLEFHNSSEPALAATQKAWNPQSREYECYVCHRGFRALSHLNQHLASPIHKQSLYHCPGRICGKQFPTLAAMVNHLESESCGTMRFQQVQRAVQQITNPGRMIASMS